MSSSSAKLRTITIFGLLNHDELAIKTLLTAGVEDGFFYLDLRASETQCLLDASAGLTELAGRLFDLPKEELAKFDLDTSTNKLLDLDAQEQRPWPELLAQYRELLSLFVGNCHWVGKILLEYFSGARDQQAVPLLDNHRYGKLSTSALGLLKYPANAASTGDQLGQIAHTDVGSITVLYAQLGGLQVLDSQGSWKFVQPKAGHAVVNIGDSLRFLTGKMLRSSLHRVVPHPDVSD
ncbi:unnamed protein product [Alternaria alternata]